ncbi:translation initiation factor IF-2 [Candidatus Shapirobacteria bacterium CG06_land_8_20_14_3_00_40_12]|uniref:Translation initiation factor IF-2 n=2 Tax=Candidatus Shapironibacteriota TaxID=1752721 RepID=A0A2M7TTV9_9BACT|nr:MAG: translation initiation factor IF-2 [Candidatus Shapirobacteria bacterium CG06_land_8_20_14_3_00_40_12]PIZ60603.1 MAG: translation initiation factor IF-2 [Candidatus Shapirobacteria bacterium CG_4_10_14_0_2_um_filter_40_12]
MFRPPIVTIMGHIDHGKTTLLDKIRSASVAAREAGGITQHISAYQTEVKLKSGKTATITFLDTPGHAAFCQMRTRGAQITDLVVLVVSAVDGVMAQTKECIKEIKRSGVPVIVAMTKMDLDGAAPEKIKGQLVELEIVPEDYGGQTSLIPVSAKTGNGIDKLLETIILNAEVMELKDESASPLEAVVIESLLDKSRGPVATLIVKKGTIHLGDQIFAESISGKVKAMSVSPATPSTPVEILGFESVPPVGACVTSIPTPTQEKTVVSRLNQTRTDGTPRLPIVVKADVQGTLEALLSSLSDDVFLIASGVGTVTDNDVFLAASSKAQIFAYNVSVPRFIRNLADNQKVPLFESKIIYEIIDDIQAQVLRLLDPTIEETTLGEAKIIAEFKIEKVHIAGIEVIQGEIGPGDSIHLRRDDAIIKDTKVEGIRQAKTVVNKAKSGSQYGITFKPYIDFKVGDAIIAYKS